MGEVVSFVDYQPPARFDATPWTEARIEEAVTETGTWTQLEAIALDPLDDDPENPAARSFTTELGTAVDYWYRVVFADAADNTAVATAPVQNHAVPAVTAYTTVEELARVLKLRSYTEAQAVAMQRVLDSAAFEIDSEIGRPMPHDSPPALVVEVNLERAVEHWQQQESPFGIVGLGGEAVPTMTARDSWDRHAHKLAPFKQSWGLA